MKIDHAAMYLNDLEQGRAFFEKYFDAKAGELYHNKKTGFRSYFLSFDDQARLEIMNVEPLNTAAVQPAAGFAHLAFNVGSKDKVDEMTERLKKDGFEVISGPRTTGDGYYESCFLDREGNRIEITI